MPVDVILGETEINLLLSFGLYFSLNYKNCMAKQQAQCTALNNSCMNNKCGQTFAKITVYDIFFYNPDAVLVNVFKLLFIHVGSCHSPVFNWRNPVLRVSKHGDFTVFALWDLQF